MNCQTGDLAIVIRDDNGSPNVGKMVTCIAISRTTERHGPIWAIDRELEWACGPLAEFPDAYLLPIRPEVDPEEMMSMDDLPNVGPDIQKRIREEILK